MPISRIGTDGIEAGAVAPSDLSTGAPYWDGSGNVGIGTSSPSTAGGKLTVVGSGTYTVSAWNSTAVATNVGATYYMHGGVDANNLGFIGAYFSGSATTNGGHLTFGTRDVGGTATEKARIDASGNLLVGLTSGVGRIYSQADGSTQPMLRTNDTYTTSAVANTWSILRNGTQVGTVTTTLSATAYNTSSDYRLKTDVVPMTGALAKVFALKPVTYKWKLDGSDGEGFIAHELAEVCPQAVSGEKDAVDADGNPIYQGIDTSFLVATLTAAIQEQQQMIETLQAKVAALEAK